MSTADRFNWSGPGIEITKQTDDETMQGVEVKGGIRRVRDPDFWGLPYGTVLAPGMKPRPKNVGKHKRGKDSSQSLSRVRSGRSRSKTPDKAPGKTQRPAASRAKALERAWGEDAGSQMDVRRKNVAKDHTDYKIEYVSKRELNKARGIAVERAKRAPQPDKGTIARNKWIIKEFGGPGTGAGDIRGDAFQRSQRSWDTYVNFGGLDTNGYDKGYVPCLGCGVKMTWHDDSEYSSYPKFEHDKIITTGDGGSYNAQNVVPMCAGCNNQRGNKKMWESPVFKGAKPEWYTPKFENLVKSTRPNKNAKFTRPRTEMTEYLMPVPPGKARTRREGKSLLDRLNSFWKITDANKSKANASNGDRVRARLWNFDGRHNSEDAGVYPPDVDDPTVWVVGRLVLETVDSAFGKYERATVIGDDGTIRWVEEDTIEQVAGAPDYDDEDTFSEDTNAGGGGGGGRGRPDTRTGNGLGVVRRGGAGTKASALLAELETKGRVRRVRSEAGVARFGLPIGAIITADALSKINPARRSSSRRREIFKGVRGRTFDDYKTPTSKEIKDFEDRVNKSSPHILPALKTREMYGAMNLGQGERVHISRDAKNPNLWFGVYTLDTGSNNSIDQSFVAGSQTEAYNLIAALSSRTHKRLRSPGNEYDSEGYWPTNRKPRDVDAFVANYEGVRGVDWHYPDDNTDDDYDSRLALVNKEAKELGYKWGGNYGSWADDEYNPVGLWAKEVTNAIMRTHDTMYPGFAGLHEAIISDNRASSRNALAWNGRAAGMESNGYDFDYTQKIVMGMNPNFFGEQADAYSDRVDSLFSSSDREKRLIPWHAVDYNKLQEETGLEKFDVMTIAVMTHELGHTVGNIMQNALYADGKRSVSGHDVEDPNATVGNVFRDDLLDLLYEYGILKSEKFETYSQFNSAANARKLTMDFDRAALAQQLSAYGSTNIAEMFAETWAAYQLDPEPSQFAMELGSLMEEALEMFLSEETGARSQIKSFKPIWGVIS